MNDVLAHFHKAVYDLTASRDVIILYMKSEVTPFHFDKNVGKDVWSTIELHKSL